MPLQNRVTPEGAIIGAAARGRFMGNRGRLHTPDQTLGTSRWTTRAWVTCRLSFRGRRRTLMAPGRYTELFFLDEAVALAAGHRPCGECRRDAYRAFRDAWTAATGGTDATIQQLDGQMHASRVEPRSRQQVRHRRSIDDLPDGVFVALPERSGMKGAWLLWADRLHLYAPDGYHASVNRPRGGTVDVLTPSVTVAALAAGYRPEVHPSLGLPAAGDRGLCNRGR
ncbi:MAG TPA: hypothetical protein VFZ01_14195 [Geminicoccaceae bacterium]